MFIASTLCVLVLSANNLCKQFGPRSGSKLFDTLKAFLKKKFENCFVFVWFDSLRPINNLSVIKGRVFLAWTSTKLGLMFLLKDTMQWPRWGSNPLPLSLESSTLPLSHSAPYWKMLILKKVSRQKQKHEKIPSMQSSFKGGHAAHW